MSSGAPLSLCFQCRPAALTHPRSSLPPHSLADLGYKQVRKHCPGALGSHTKPKGHKLLSPWHT